MPWNSSQGLVSRFFCSPSCALGPPSLSPDAWLFFNITMHVRGGYSRRGAQGTSCAQWYSAPAFYGVHAVFSALLFPSIESTDDSLEMTPQVMHMGCKREGVVVQWKEQLLLYGSCCSCGFTYHAVSI